MNIIVGTIGNYQIDRISNESIYFHKRFRNCIYISILAIIALVTSTATKQHTGNITITMDNSGENKMQYSIKEDSTA